MPFCYFVWNIALTSERGKSSILNMQMQPHRIEIFKTSYKLDSYDGSCSLDNRLAVTVEFETTS
jgi:hypothetical protein